MLAIFAVGTLFGYSFGSAPISYHVQVSFDGYIPVLGGIEQPLKVDMDLRVTGKEGGSDEKRKVLSEITQFRLSVYDAETQSFSPFPIGLEAVREYFPATTTTYRSSGKILATDAVDRDIPFQLPGLHPQHLADMTFLLLEFPEKPVEPNETWTYKRTFGKSDVLYEARYAGKEEQGERFDLKLSQSYEGFEDANRNPVPKELAATRVVTKVEGTGSVWFSGPSGRIVKATVTANGTSDVVSLEGQPVAKRTLKTSFYMESQGG
ncbi:MAG: hypothetical protein KatS3mg015_1921 [Fimbriimonadales bacterium]|jgi:hypothetical protein|nr:MAG: hypothetical protein KatS3mg015_1921 [Fimbriimonadales bacterium]